MSVDAAMMSSSPHTLSQYVLKVHSRCDLACDHCYVYEHADQSWRRRPRVMAPETIKVAANRIAEHAAARELRQVHVVLHGGEPLLMGATALRSAVSMLHKTISPVAAVDLRMQTNGLLLSPEICDLLAEYDVRVGISLDGDRQANDRHRRYANGASSHESVIGALKILRRPAYRRIYAGILCTIDVDNDPIRAYEALVAQEPPRLDFLLPHATWDRPPPRPVGSDTPYAHWLLTIYDRWVSDGQPVPIRVFDSLRATAAGGPSGIEWVGLDPADLIVIETDGAWEQADSLKTTFDGGPATGFDIFSHSVDQVAAFPQIARRQTGVADLSATCRACVIVAQCGGGLFAHRFSEASGFDNPSVYCDDLKELIVTINRSGASARAATAASPSAPAVDGDDFPQQVFDQVGAGYGDGSAVGYLADRQLAITRALMVSVADLGAEAAVVNDGWDLLDHVERTAPLMVEAVLSHPYLRVWAVEQLRHQDGVAEDSDYIDNVAVAAAIRADLAVEFRVPVRGGRVHLPTLGTVVLATPSVTVAQLSIAAGGFTVRAGDNEISVTGHGVDAAPGWRPARRLVTDGWEILFEDADPYRDRYPWRAHDYLSEDALTRWRRSTADAWRLIGVQTPVHLPGMRRGLRVLTPVTADGAHQMRSATLRHAFGALAAAPADAASLAMTFVHEFQHSKLGAILDMCDLLDPTNDSYLRVGWRPEPRPVEMALQGAYAHLGVADMWYSRARSEPARLATDQFRQYRDWTVDAIGRLLSCGALTSTGIAFVSHMAETVASWSG